MRLLKRRGKKSSSPSLDIDLYWLLAGALCRAFEDYQDGPEFWCVVAELDEAFPGWGWANVMTDRWPLGDKPLREQLGYV